MVDSADSEPTLDAEQEYAQRKSAEREAYQRKRQQVESQWAQEKRWKEGWQALTLA